VTIDEQITALVESNKALSSQIAELTRGMPKPIPASVTRAEFDKATPAERHRLIKGGCAVVDPTPAAHPEAPLRAAHSAMAFAKAGRLDKAAEMIKDRGAAFAALRTDTKLARTFVPAEFVDDYDRANSR